MQIFTELKSWDWVHIKLAFKLDDLLIELKVYGHTP